MNKKTQRIFIKKFRIIQWLQNSHETDKKISVSFEKKMSEFEKG